MLTVIREMATAAADACRTTLSLGTLLATVEEAGARSRRAHHRPACRRCATPASSTPAATACSCCSRGVAGVLGRDRQRSRGRSVTARGSDRAAGGAARHGAGPADDAIGAVGASATARASCSQGEGLDRDDLERFSAPIGDSALVVGDERLVKVHVHTNDPGARAHGRAQARRDRRHRDQRHARADPRPGRAPAAAGRARHRGGGRRRRRGQQGRSSASSAAQPWSTAASP